MKTTSVATLVFFICLQFTLHAVHLEERLSPSIIQTEATAIDKILNRTYQKRNVEIPDKVSESALVRRLYLSLVGRIPTYGEINSYLYTTSVQKKSLLIEELTESYGYNSHMFNWWADLLRLKSQMRGGNQIQAGQLYNHWVKEQVGKNVPFDQMAYSLVTAEGYPWENGAVGYYLRDTGMPLDNMSNTAQIFLGTQMVCAQCHNHPFDKWTQMEYYKMASFTYGVSTRMGQGFKNKISQYFSQQTKDLSKTQRNELSNTKKVQSLRKAIQEMVQPLRYGAAHTGRKLSLPHDYQYEDAKPKSVVDSEPIFATDSLNKEIENPVDAYGQWIISTNNPRFTKVISNRMWKKVFGRGIIEPVDDLRDDSESSIPELLTHLESLMIRVKYDLKKFQQILHHVKAFEREATGRELTSVEKYYFEAPILKRMSAEQLWDSIVTLSIPEVDERKTNPSKVESRLANFANYQKKIEGLTEKKIIQLAKKGSKENARINNNMNEIQLKIREAQEADDRLAVSRLRREYGEKRNEQKSLFASLIMGPEFDTRSLYRGGKSKNSFDDRWKGYSGNLMRAAEIETPAPPGHFLREFGQSDREVIENSSNESSVPQALTLLNGVFYKALFDPRSPLSQNLLKANTTEAKIHVLFLSILNRNPSAEELSQSLSMVTSVPKVPYQVPLPNKVSSEKKKKYLKSIQDKKQKLAYYNDRDFRGIAWSLINTRQFSFIQ